MQSLRFCPVCGKKLIKHKIGSNRWYCGYCRLYFYQIDDEIYAKKMGNWTKLMKVEDVLRSIKYKENNNKDIERESIFI